MFEKKDVDAHGQPLNQGFHFNRLEGRSADELIGICKGVLADGHIDQSEAEFVLRWVERNAIYVDRWPFNALAERLHRALVNGTLTSEGEKDLLTFMSELTGPESAEGAEESACELLCTKPAPVIAFPGMRFVLTGKFVSGPRDHIAEQIEKAGGELAASVSKKTNYLVIGSYGSRDWLMSNCGLKIIKAQELIAAGASIGVIAERHYLAQLSA